MLRIHLVPTDLPHCFLLLHPLFSGPTLLLLFDLKQFCLYYYLVALFAFVHALQVLTGI